ncbi:hypothetical protein VTO73DRAFT_7354 [Trametes versicolor]
MLSSHLRHRSLPNIRHLLSHNTKFTMSSQPTQSFVVDERLVIGGIYAVANVIMSPTQDDVASDQWHWGLYHHLHATQGGYKMHITGRPGRWMFEDGRTNSIMRSSVLIGAMRIGYCPIDKNDRIVAIAKSIPPTGPPEGFDKLTCWTWVLSIIRLFCQAGYVRCASQTRLAEEFRAWAAEHTQTAFEGHRPRPVQDSSTCILTPLGQAAGSS